jgi:hypothetical protein
MFYSRFIYEELTGVYVDILVYKEEFVMFVDDAFDYVN